jgi:hypothetical protein
MELKDGYKDSTLTLRNNAITNTYVIDDTLISLNAYSPNKINLDLDGQIVTHSLMSFISVQAARYVSMKNVHLSICAASMGFGDVTDLLFENWFLKNTYSSRIYFDSYVITNTYLLRNFILDQVNLSHNCHEFVGCSWRWFFFDHYIWDC